MKIQENIENNLKSVPEGYYDLIVYLSSGVFFSIGLLYLSTPFAKVLEITKEINVLNSIIIFIVIFVFITLQGQLASSFSGIFIKLLVNLIHKLFKLTKSKFYYNNRTIYTTMTSVDGYWDDLFWIYLNHPEIAKIMIKRYARVKLSRANAFNCLLLLILYFIFKFSNRLSPSIDNGLILSILITISIVLIIEYWLRQVWFNDGLKKFIVIAKKLSN